jgi:flagellar FliJ protein
MANFTFRLEPLLKLRKAERDRRREELSEAYQAEQVLAAQQQVLRQEMEQTKTLSKKRSQPGSIQVEHLLNANRYELLLTSQLQQLAAQQQQVKGEIERRRQVLVEADRQLRVLEKLRQRHEEAYRTAEAKLETRRMDEVALQRRQGQRAVGSSEQGR